MKLQDYIRITKEHKINIYVQYIGYFVFFLVAILNVNEISETLALLGIVLSIINFCEYEKEKK